MAKKISNIVSMQRDFIYNQLISRYVTDGKGSYTIEVKFDEKGKGSIKTTIRDGEITKFKEKFNKSLELNPDSVIVRQYKGEKGEAMEQTDALQEIRITDLKTKREIAPSLGSVDEQVKSSFFELEKQKELFRFEQEKRELEYNHTLQIRDKNDEINRISKALTQCEETIKEQSDEIKELSRELEELEKKGGMNANALLTAGLNGLGELARKNPNGKFLGIVSNKIISDYITPQNENQSSADESNNERNTKITNITNFATQLSDSDIDALYEVMVILSQGDTSQNLQKVLIHLKSNS